MKVSVLVPLSGDLDRRRLWRWIRDVHYARLRRVAPIEFCVGTTTGPWCKAAAVADAAARASGEILVVHDADCYLSDEQLMAAAAVVADGTERWVVPHDHVLRFTALQTAAVLAGRIPDGPFSQYRAPAGGGIAVLPRAAYETVGGLDRRFVGWGGEDEAFARSLDTLWGRRYRPRRGRALVHLWHEPARDRHAASPETAALAARYRAADGDPVEMRALIGER